MGQSTPTTAFDPWSNLICLLYNVETLNICMKEFGSKKIFFNKMTSMFHLSLAKTKFFSLTLTVRGYLISIAY